jgi:hypothetical protein
MFEGVRSAGLVSFFGGRRRRREKLGSDEQHAFVGDYDIGEGIQWSAWNGRVKRLAHLRSIVNESTITHLRVHSDWHANKPRPSQIPEQSSGSQQLSSRHLGGSSSSLQSSGQRTLGQGKDDSHSVPCAKNCESISPAQSQPTSQHNNNAVRSYNVASSRMIWSPIFSRMVIERPQLIEFL